LRSDQYLITVNERRLRSNDSTVKWELDNEDVFLDSLICCQK